MPARSRSGKLPRWLIGMWHGEIDELVEKVVDAPEDLSYLIHIGNESGDRDMDHVNDYLAKNRKSAEYPVAPPMFFKRGNACISVQASSGHYCSPQNDTGPYTMVEVLVPHPRFKVPKSFGKPVKNPDRKDKSRLFTWVPVDAVNAEIERRGGIA